MMELEKIRAYAELMQELNLSKLEIREGDNALSLERGGLAQPTAPIATAPAAPVSTAAPADDADIYTVASPMVGVFFAAPEADGKPYVKLGDHVKKGDILCIIEAMKLMNEIAAEHDGVIEEICVGNKQVVDFGHPLFRIRRAGR
jgi:acetyl-CoA carboxylase biotin carboxyl carrier protein